VALEFEGSETLKIFRCQRVFQIGDKGMLTAHLDQLLNNLLSMACSLHAFHLITTRHFWVFVVLCICVEVDAELEWLGLQPLSLSVVCLVADVNRSMGRFRSALFLSPSFRCFLLSAIKRWSTGPLCRSYGILPVNPTLLNSIFHVFESLSPRSKSIEIRPFFIRFERLNPRFSTRQNLLQSFRKLHKTIQKCHFLRTFRISRPIYYQVHFCVFA